MRFLVELLDVPRRRDERTVRFFHARKVFLAGDVILVVCELSALTAYLLVQWRFGRSEIRLAFRFTRSKALSKQRADRSTCHNDRTFGPERTSVPIDIAEEIGFRTGIFGDMRLPPIKIASMAFRNAVTADSNSSSRVVFSKRPSIFREAFLRQKALLDIKHGREAGEVEIREGAQLR